MNRSNRFPYPPRVGDLIEIIKDSDEENSCLMPRTIHRVTRLNFDHMDDGSIEYDIYVKGARDKDWVLLETEYQLAFPKVKVLSQKQLNRWADRWEEFCKQSIK